MKPIFPARFELQPDGGYLVQFIDLPEVMTEGAQVDIGGNEKYFATCRKHFRLKVCDSESVT